MAGGRGVEVSDEARAAQAQAVARLVSSGWLYLCSGERPVSPNAIQKAEQVVARVPVLTSNVSVNRDALTIRPLNGEAERKGLLVWWRLATPNGNPLLDGDIGLEDSGDGEVRLSRLDLLPGDKIQIAAMIVQPRRRTR